MFYSEDDTRVKFIDPALKESEWTEELIVRNHYFTDGRKLLNNKRGPRKFADYLLKYRSQKLAIIEAKKYGDGATKGLEQAKDYAKKLGIRFVFSSDGKEHYQFDMEEGRGEFIKSFPSPEELYQISFGQKNQTTTKLINEKFLLEANFKPRYYQEAAVDKAVEAIGEGNNRVLLTLATGTGKTFIAFQIAHKLLQSNWNLDKEDRKPKILFLADRNVLADQAINAFNYYEKDLVKINGEEVRKRKGKVPTNAFIFFAIYQAIADRENGEEIDTGFFRAYPKDFFDLIIIDECHRGSANEAGSWREILDYFDTAVHLGMTATPKREDNVDTYNYFGKPVYEYSLKDGIEDGYLTPYKVKRIKTNIDEYLYTSEDKVLSGEIEEKLYEIPDFNRTIVIPKREELIAKTILETIQPHDKTIIFCQDQPHARLIRDIVNVFKMVRHPDYCVVVTSDEGKIGREYLKAFQDNDKTIPTILTSSQMLTTGVDARNVRNVVLLRSIGSMVEFKQIIGRGTRLFEGKDFFTIIDFTGATKHFYDKEWDGLADEAVDVQVEEVTKKKRKGKAQEPDPMETDLNLEEFGIGEDSPNRDKVVVELSNGRILKVIDIETRYADPETGKPLSTKEFLEKLLGVIPIMFKDEHELRTLWSKPETREQVLEALAKKGFDEEQLDCLRDVFEAGSCDVFDVLMHIAFSKDMITRRKRVETVKEDKSFYHVYENLKAQDFLNFVLERYALDGPKELKKDNLGQLIQMKKYKTVREAAKDFGNIDNLQKAFYELQENIYKVE